MRNQDSQDTKLNDTVEKASVDVLIGHSLRTAQALRLHLETSMKEADYLQVEGHKHQDARAFIIYGALDEVQKACVHLMDLAGSLETGDVNPYEDHVSRNVKMMLDEHVIARGRRLVEVLTNLVLFTTTNQQPYFRHLLMLEELTALLRDNQDREEFHGARSVLIDKQITELVLQISVLQSQNSLLTDAWYAGKGAAGIRPGVKPNPNTLLTSARHRIKEAFSAMSAGEKISIGFTYGEGYSEFSETIHYSSRENSAKLLFSDSSVTSRRLSLLVYDLLIRCHQILGSPQLPLISKLADDFSTNQHPHNILNQYMVRGIKAGDFVLVYGIQFLAEVLEVKESSYGYRSYRVLFLAECPGGVREDWILARYINKMYSKEEMLQYVSVPNAHMPEEDRQIIQDIFSVSSPDILQEAVRETILELWKSGLSQYYRDKAFQTGINSNVQSTPSIS